MKKKQRGLISLPFLNFVFGILGLHSPTYYTNTHLFKKFIAKFTAESSETERKQKDDFVEVYRNNDTNQNNYRGFY